MFLRIGSENNYKRSKMPYGYLTHLTKEQETENKELETIMADNNIFIPTKINYYAIIQFKATLIEYINELKPFKANVHLKVV